VDRLTRSDILVVCTANVCRSPLTEFLLQDLLRNARGFETVAVGSVGTRPMRGVRMCELAASGLEGPEAEPFVHAHKSLSATQSRLRKASLILTASRSNRAAVAHILPQARTRTFTLKEAIALGEGFSLDGDTGAEAVRSFARYLESRRGIVAPVAPTGIRRWLASSSSDPWSIVDGHNLGAKQHARTIAEVRSVVQTLGAIMTEGVREPSSSRSA